MKVKFARMGPQRFSVVEFWKRKGAYERFVDAGGYSPWRLMERWEEGKGWVLIFVDD